MTGIKTAWDRRFGIEEYLVWSTVIAVVMFVPLKGTFQIGYIIAIVNASILLLFDQLKIHRNHLWAILALTGFSLIGAQLSGTPFISPILQIMGISVMSIYFFNALTNFDLSVPRWMELYMRVAFAMAVYALIVWPLAHYSDEPRLKGIYSEPSFYIYVTLPAVGYCINRFVNEQRYGRETLVFLLSYMLADSSLGFLGLLLIGLFTYGPRLKGKQILSGFIVVCALITALYAASTNLRVRANELATAIVRQDLSSTSSSTFAFLSNIYVTSQSFLAHPLTGVGIGGYANAYDKYVGEVTDTVAIPNAGFSYIASMELNRDDANSMFLRVGAELGGPGLILLFGFLIVCARVRGMLYTTIRNAILPYLLVRMTRMGHYFTVELYFFVGLYLLNYLNYRAAHGTGRKAQRRPPLCPT